MKSRKDQKSRSCGGEKKRIVYHRDGVNGEYDDFNDVEQLINFILTGVR